MGSRLELQKILEKTIGNDNVYFQPPESVKLKYPCIIYSIADMVSDEADNIKYSTRKVYSITVIDRNPDSEIPDRIFDLQYCSFQRNYTSDNLYHNVFRLYY